MDTAVEKLLKMGVERKSKLGIASVSEYGETFILKMRGKLLFRKGLKGSWAPEWEKKKGGFGTKYVYGPPYMMQHTKLEFYRLTPQQQSNLEDLFKLMVVKVNACK